jgi:hypothetical protein
MMVAIHEAGHDDMPVRAENNVRLILRCQFPIGTDVDNRAIALEHRTIFDDVRFSPADDIANHVLAVN